MLSNWMHFKLKWSRNIETQKFWLISCFAEKDLMMDFNYFHYLGNEQYISTSLVQKITSSGMLIYVKTNKTKTQGPGGQASFCISNFHGQKLIIWVPQKILVPFLESSNTLPQGFEKQLNIMIERILYSVVL